MIARTSLATGDSELTVIKVTNKYRADREGLQGGILRRYTLLLIYTPLGFNENCCLFIVPF